MKIGLIGYGKMGKAVERIALERGHTIVFKANSASPLSSIDVSNADIAIEFSQPNLVLDHIQFSLANKLPIVVGTTAWQNDLSVVTNWVSNENGSLLHASNFSIGVNILFHINERLAQLMSQQKAYSASIEEIHHVQKLDAPSGTAVSLAQGLIENHAGYEVYKSETGSSPLVNKGELAITALREPDVPGTHTISYSSNIDTLSLTHVAHSRDGFATGAVLAAEFLVGKKGIFTMRDVLSF